MAAASAIPDDVDEAELAEAELEARAAAAKYDWRLYAALRSPDDYAGAVLGAFLGLGKDKARHDQLRWQSAALPTSLLHYGAKDLVRAALAAHANIVAFASSDTDAAAAAAADGGAARVRRAQELLRAGATMPDLTTEIFAQLCKQLSFNPHPEDAARTWQLLALACSTYVPRRDFVLHLMHFLLEARDSASSSTTAATYARYCLRALADPPQPGQPPIEAFEINAFGARLPLVARVELLGGAAVVKALAVAPYHRIGDVLDSCAHRLGLTSQAQLFGLFLVEELPPAEGDSVDTAAGEAAALAAAARESKGPRIKKAAKPKSKKKASRRRGDDDEEEDDENDHHDEEKEEVDDEEAKEDASEASTAAPFAGLPRTPQPLRRENWLSDVLTPRIRSGRAFRLVFRKKLFLPQNFDVDPPADAALQRLLYLQALSDVLSGDLPVESEDKAAELAALAVGIACGARLKKKRVSEFVQRATLSDYVPAGWRDLHEQDVWSARVPPLVLALADSDEDAPPPTVTELQRRFVDAVQRAPLYGALPFHVRRLTSRCPAAWADFPLHVIICIGGTGLNIVNEARETLTFLPYEDIKAWRLSEAQLTLTFIEGGDETLSATLFSAQPIDICTLLIEYVLALEWCAGGEDGPPPPANADRAAAYLESLRERRRARQRVAKLVAASAKDGDDAGGGDGTAGGKMSTFGKPKSSSSRKITARGS